MPKLPQKDVYDFAIDFVLGAVIGGAVIGFTYLKSDLSQMTPEEFKASHALAHMAIASGLIGGSLCALSPISFWFLLSAFLAVYDVPNPDAPKPQWIPWWGVLTFGITFLSGIAMLVFWR